MSALRAIVLSVVMTLCAAQRCCMPPQWEGIQAGKGGAVINDKAVKTFDFMVIAYDGINKKLSVRSNSTVGEKQAETWVIQHFQEGVAYTIDLKTQNCTKGKIDVPMQPLCVPGNAKPGVKIVYGGGTQHLLCQTYMWEMTEPDVNLDFTVVVVEDGQVCYPVFEEIVGSAAGRSLVEANGFVDLTTGIKDPSVFNPPSYCNQAPMTTGITKMRYTFLGL